MQMKYELLQFNDLQQPNHRQMKNRAQPNSIQFSPTQPVG